MFLVVFLFLSKLVCLRHGVHYVSVFSEWPGFPVINGKTRIFVDMVLKIKNCDSGRLLFFLNKCFGEVQTEFIVNRFVTL